MKIKTLCLLTSLAVAATAAAQSPRGAGGTADCPEQRPCGTATTSAALAPLAANAQQAMLFQIEEERMAGEIYAALGAKWELRQFHNIQRAERRHEQALRSLASRVSLEVPAAIPGKFASPVVQSRYDALLARGLVSSAEALAVGAVVEQQDIADLRVVIGEAASPELKALAETLLAASERHLRAFTSGGPRGQGDAGALGRFGGQTGRRGTGVGRHAACVSANN